jgi:hypothetical protein
VKGSLVLGLLGVVGAFAVISSGRRQKRAPPAPRLDTSLCTWHLPDPVPPEIVQRALAIHAQDPPMGTEYVEEIGGKIWKFKREFHGPNAQNPTYHAGVGVRRCDPRKPGDVVDRGTPA